MYTLQDYFKAAELPTIPEYAKDIPLKFTPAEHQVSGLRLSIAYTRTGNYDETGAGKTIISQGFLVFWSQFGNKAVVLMPPVLLDQFKDSFSENMRGIDDHLNIHLFRHSPAKREKLYDQWEDGQGPDILLMSYHIFRTEFRRLKYLGYNVLVADEATALKNASSKIFKAVFEFIGKTDETQCATMIMTGTPAENTLIDLYAPIRLITPDNYRSKRMFEDLHVLRNHHSPYKEITGYYGQDLIKTCFYQQARRVLKKDVMDLPDKIITEVPVTLAPWHQTLYDTLVRERILELGDGEIIDAVQAQALRQATQRILYSPHKFTDSPGRENVPLETVSTLLDSIGTHNHKVILFAHYRDTVELLAEKYADLNPSVLYGGSTGRAKQITAFKEDDDCRLLIANIVSAGVGLNLQDVCSHIIFTESVSIPGRVFQAIDRVHRPGQTETANIYMITVNGTVSVSIRNDLVGKEEENNKVVMDRKTLLADLSGSAGIVGVLE